MVRLAWVQPKMTKIAMYIVLSVVGVMIIILGLLKGTYLIAAIGLGVLATGGYRAWVNGDRQT
jgi:uncharacterized membrane protein